MSSDNIFRNQIILKNASDSNPNPNPSNQPQPQPLSSVQQYILSLTMEQRQELNTIPPQLYNEDGSVTYYPPSSPYFLPRLFEKYVFNAVSKECQNLLIEKYPGWQKQIVPIELRCGNHYNCKFKNQFTEPPKRACSNFLESIDENDQTWINLHESIIQLVKTYNVRNYASRTAFHNTLKALANRIIHQEIFTTETTEIKNSLFIFLKGKKKDVIHLRMCQLKSLFFHNILRKVFHTLPKAIPDLWQSERTERTPSTPISQESILQ